MKRHPPSLYDLLDRLRQAKIHHHIRADRLEAVSIEVAVPGELWEIDVLADSTVEVEVFKSNGKIHDNLKLQELFERFSN